MSRRGATPGWVYERFLPRQPERRLTRREAQDRAEQAGTCICADEFWMLCHALELDAKTETRTNYQLVQLAMDQGVLKCPS